jgi:hypothetical protein
MPQASHDPIASSNELLTIEDVARKLGMSIATVRLRVTQRFFHPLRQGRRLMFHPSEVDAELDRVETIRRQRLGKVVDTSPPKIDSRPRKLPEAVPDKQGKMKPPEPSAKPTDSVQVGSLIYNGQQCAAAVKLFREGKEVLDAVAEMELTFEVAKHFWKQYLDLQPVWVLPNKQFAQLRLQLDWEEDPPTPEGFMKALRAHIDKVVEREAAAKVRREIGEEISPEEKAELERLDAELAAQAARKAAAKAPEEKKP